jgi:hypothetical protein
VPHARSDPIDVTHIFFPDGFTGIMKENVFKGWLSDRNRGNLDPGRLRKVNGEGDFLLTVTHSYPHK